ncbi:MAG: hypothetical protein QY310_11610 [Candidatus Jettenia sp. CY-1]|nr:MAG: hypothetical protein QY310_11610 [Candidatus Jettenia sp. CY-1]
MLQKSSPEKPSKKKKVYRGVMLLKCLLPGDGIIRDKRLLRWQGNVIKSAKFISMFRIYPFGGFAPLNPHHSLLNHSIGWIKRSESIIASGLMGETGLEMLYATGISPEYVGRGFSLAKQP